MTPARADIVAAEIARRLAGARVDISAEKPAQAGIAAVLRSLGYDIAREALLCGQEGEKLGAIDFIVGATGGFAGVGVEVKVAGASKTDAYRQLERYARSPRVLALVLATSLAMGLPAQLEGKPVYRASLARGWM